ncbi:hypothetical protein [Streptosporangium sp. NPDC004631]
MKNLHGDTSVQHVGGGGQAGGTHPSHRPDTDDIGDAATLTAPPFQHIPAR